MPGEAGLGFTMGRKKIQISRITDERNRQVIMVMVAMVNMVNMVVVLMMLKWW